MNQKRHTHGDFLARLQRKQVRSATLLACPPGQPCGCGCHCVGGLDTSVAGTPPPPDPTYPPPWWTAPCPPWGCPCNYAVCVDGVTNPGPPAPDFPPYPKPGLPGGLKN